MPKTKPYLNGFPPAKAAEIVGLSVHMLNYLARHRYLVPHYSGAGQRGRVRYYSYRDLVVARIVKGLLASGLEIGRLKKGIARLADEAHWTAEPDASLRMLATDGADLFFVDADGSLQDLTMHGQLAFAFLLDVDAAQKDVRHHLSEDQLAHFTTKNLRLRQA